jgi:metal-dependent hydrolase (beta-lactamase superfamily II)
MTLQRPIVFENTVGRPISACREHGFSCFVKTSSSIWLFDTGSGETLEQDAHQIDSGILSHGHYDQCTGQMRSAHFPKKVSLPTLVPQ